MKAPKIKSNKKKLISTSSIVAIVLIAVIAGNIFVWKNRSARDADINSITGNITTLTQNIKKVPTPSSDVQARLSAATANLTAAQALFPDKFNRNDVVDYIIRLSRTCNVDVLPINSQGWVEDDNDPSHTILKLNATVLGTFTQTNDFIYRLQHGDYKTIVIPELSYTRLAGSNNSTLFSGDNTTVSVVINVDIYANVEGATP